MRPQQILVPECIKPVFEEILLECRRYYDLGEMQELCGQPRYKDIRTKGAIEHHDGRNHLKATVHAGQWNEIVVNTILRCKRTAGTNSMTLEEINVKGMPENSASLLLSVVGYLQKEGDNQGYNELLIPRELTATSDFQQETWSSVMRQEPFELVDDNYHVWLRTEQLAYPQDVEKTLLHLAQENE